MTALHAPTPIPDDVIDLLAGVQPGDAVDRLRRQRPVTRQHAQQSHVALFQPHADSAHGFPVVERHAVAAFVAGLHQPTPAAAYYAATLAAQDAPAGWSQAIAAEVQRGLAQGPYGHYPQGPLTAENQAGPHYLVTEAFAPVLGTRLAAALNYAHRLVYHPRDASAGALQALLDAGWSETGVVSLSQLVAFLAFQIRVATGLRTLAAYRLARPRATAHS